MPQLWHPLRRWRSLTMALRLGSKFTGFEFQLPVPPPNTEWAPDIDAGQGSYILIPVIDEDPDIDDVDEDPTGELP